MAGTGAIGLVAVFAVDLINLFYISLLGEKSIAAAVGFASVVGFFHVSICIGLTIGVAAIVSREVGAGRMADAKRIATHCLVAIAFVTTLLAAITLSLLQSLLALLGAAGVVAELAHRYLNISLLSLPLLGVGMASSALLRSVGDAKRAMWVTLSAAAVTAVLDPLLIFGFGWGLDGAAIVSVISRAALLGIAWNGVVHVHQLLAAFSTDRLGADARLLAHVAAPAVLSNLATPVGAAFVTHSVAQFGPAAVAGMATIDRLTPVAFGLVYSLSAAVGPIVSQNLGAKEFDRVRAGLRASLYFMLTAVATAWLLLALLQTPLTHAFSLQGTSALMLQAFCSWLAAAFFFVGALFVANAAFNNLGKPLWSTGFNWARATLGTIPFAWWGAHYGPVQVMAGQALGSAIFGSLAIWTAWRLAARLGSNKQVNAT